MGYECAKDWIVKGDPGPSPGDVECENEDVVEAICKDAIESEWLSKCSDFIDFESHINTCKIDYCMDQRPEILTLIIKNLVEECIEKIDDEEFKCKWTENIETNIECPAHSTYNACAQECDQIRCLADQAVCDETSKIVPLCVCNEGYTLLNGECVDNDTCEEK